MEILISQQKLYADFDLGMPPNIVALSIGRAKDFDTRFDFPQYDTSKVVNNLSNENIKPVDRLILVLKKRKIINEDGGYEDLLRLLTPFYPQYPT